jgi:hypothetical protein
MTGASVRAALLERAAAQWAGLGVGLTSPPEHAVVDLEALVLLTAAVGEDDPRVLEGGQSWCGTHGRFLNEARLRRVAAEMRVPEDLGRSLVGSRGRTGPPRDLGPAHPRATAAVLSWVLRATFGVNARADLVATLAARTSRPGTVSELASLVRFGKRNVAIALDDLVLAGVVERQSAGAVPRYALRDRRTLLRWLSLRGDVAYRDWVSEFSIGLQLAGFQARSWSSRLVMAIEARALVAVLRPAIEQAELPPPDLSATGPDFALAFDAWVAQLASRWRVT